MKKWILFIIGLFFLGCSTKTVSIPVVKKPNAVRNGDIRHLKVGNIKNDTISLKQNIIGQMQEVNNIVPGYFSFSGKYKTFLSGYVQKHVFHTAYTKTVPVKIKGPVCLYLFYSCKTAGSQIFCKNTPEMKLNPENYKKIKKQLYKHKNYIIYKNRIYKIKKTCKPTKALIYCEKSSLDITAHIVIKNTAGQTVFEKNYGYSKIKNPCSGVNVYSGIKHYRADTTFDIRKASSLISKEIISDLAPHKVYFETEIYEKPDVDLNSKDENLFELALNDDTAFAQKMTILNSLHRKYPKSCVISYDLALFYIKTDNYTEAKNLLNKVIYSGCDSDIKNSAANALANISDVY